MAINVTPDNIENSGSLLSDIEISKYLCTYKDVDNSDLIFDKGWAEIFRPITDIEKITHTEINQLIACIIYSYSPKSMMINLSANGESNNYNIAKNIGCDLKNEYIQNFINNDYAPIKNSIAAYLDYVSSDWRFTHARKCIDFHATIMKLIESLNSIAADKKAKEYLEAGKLITESSQQRKSADLIIADLKKDYVYVSHQTQQTFGREFVQTNIEFDGENNKGVTSWSDFIQSKNNK